MSENSSAYTWVTDSQYVPTDKSNAGGKSKGQGASGVLTSGSSEYTWVTDSQYVPTEKGSLKN